MLTRGYSLTSAVTSAGRVEDGLKQKGHMLTAGHKDHETFMTQQN